MFKGIPFFLYESLLNTTVRVNLSVSSFVRCMWVLCLTFVTGETSEGGTQCIDTITN